MSARGRKALADLLVRAARGQWSPQASANPGKGAAAAAPPTHQLPCFPLQQQHFGQLAGAAGRSDPSRGGVPSSSVATPSDFHAHLRDRIRSAQERVVLASLYIGVGSSTDVSTASKNVLDGTAEDQFLQALQDAASNKHLKKVQILLDANRALRKVSIAKKHHHSRMHTNSAEAVFSRIDRYLGASPTGSDSGVFLFPVNDQRLCAILPSPLDEVAGVFHIKAYIIDDELILSGANLSEEYFRDRLDRYRLFTNGGGGLVDFYADLVDILCEYAVRYEGSSGAKSVSELFSLQDEVTRKEKLEASLMNLFDGENPNRGVEYSDKEDSSPPIVAYAIPTFQMPNSFLGRPFRLKQDTEVTRNLLSCALTSQLSTSVRLSSAYLNLTPKLLSALTKYGKENEGAPYILTAGLASHGFAPKAASPKKVGFVDKIKAVVPEAFMTLVKDAAKSIIACGGKVLLYERPGWTFHAKGIWITTEDEGDRARPETIGDPSSLLATVIGSGNYGARSEDLDVESNCILVFADQNHSEDNACDVKEQVAAEWNSMCDASTELTDAKSAEDKGNVMRFVLAYMRRFL